MQNCLHYIVKNNTVILISIFFKAFLTDSSLPKALVSVFTAYNAAFFYCSFLARLFHQGFISFRKYVLEMNNLGADLHIILSDICYGAGEY